MQGQNHPQVSLPHHVSQTPHELISVLLDPLVLSDAHRQAKRPSESEEAGRVVRLEICQLVAATRRCMDVDLLINRHFGQEGSTHIKSLTSPQSSVRSALPPRRLSEHLSCTSQFVDSNVQSAFGQSVVSVPFCRELK